MSSASSDNTLTNFPYFLPIESSYADITGMYSVANHTCDATGTEYEIEFGRFNNGVSDVIYATTISNATTTAHRGEAVKFYGVKPRTNTYDEAVIMQRAYTYGSAGIGEPYGVGTSYITIEHYHTDIDSSRDEIDISFRRLKIKRWYSTISAECRAQRKSHYPTCG